MSPFYVKSVTTSRFWASYNMLPQSVRELAAKNYELWCNDPRHPSLHFKPIGDGVWSVRVGAHYRAVGQFQDRKIFVWYWIGTHDEYDRF